MRRVLFLVLALAMPLYCAARGIDSTPTRGSWSEWPTKTSAQQVNTMKIRLTTNGKVLTATLINSKIAQDFIALLPLTLTLEDYVGTEKISDLPKRLSTEGAPSGSDASAGDIAYYAPWGNLAIFYRDSGYASGLVILGKIGSIELISASGPVKVRIERIQ